MRVVNLGGSDFAEKQCGFSDTRVWFFVAMARGALAVHTFVDGASFPGENQVGAGMCIDQLPIMLKRMFGDFSKKPHVIFSDRGPGFYHRRWGTITSDYDAACHRHGFTPWAGSNAKRGRHSQPPDIADVPLYEAAISILRQHLGKSNAQIREPWKETPAAFARRLSHLVEKINVMCNLSGLCEEFPDRLKQVVLRGGDRLPK